ncbi:hypothetical protein NPS53_09340 [Pseudomonas putida]|uniref:hypothetical protein n=1 Tax=Pseudomonas putida TaxID=303 RepID=UPI0023646AB3|nr:hypothetical protein [Pseudomonas putida]MDD2139780.1 hypothetical protein [Pseudomonas putida]HDS1721704.1 hypothetical protein [Pseudomonas putida]
MDKTKLSEMLAFVNDEKRFNAAFDNVLEGIETGRIGANDFPFAAAPLRAGGLKDNREFVARFLEQAAGLPLSPEERVALDETISALPEGASIEQLYTALDSVEPLANFTAALRKAHTESLHDRS